MFLFHLARTVFHCSVHVLERTLSARELQEWIEVYAIEPWGDDWDQASTVAVASQLPWSKKRRRLDEYVPRRRRRRPEPKDVELKMRHWAAQHNANREGKEV